MARLTSKVEDISKSGVNDGDVHSVPEEFDEPDAWLDILSHTQQRKSSGRDLIIISSDLKLKSEVLQQLNEIHSNATVDGEMQNARQFEANCKRELKQKLERDDQKSWIHSVSSTNRRYEGERERVPCNVLYDSPFPYSHF